MSTIAIAGFQHETNSFADHRADYAYFCLHRDRPPLVRGGDVISHLRGGSYGLSGFLGEAGADWRLLPLVWASGGAGGPVTDDAFERIAGDMTAGLRAAVVNVDDAQGQRLADELQQRAGLALWTVSRQSPARLVARGLRHDGGGLAFELVEGTGADERSVTVQSALVGDYNADNLLLVAAALRALGFALADLGAVLAQLRPVPGRLERADGGRADEPLVLVDYAHTPDALEQVLRALRPLAQARGGRLWCVFGCGGNRDASKRPLMGAIAERLADEVVLTSDNPRDESPALILAQILAGMHEVAAHAVPAVIEERAEAIADAVQRAAPADVVLLAGKGHEAEQEIAGVKRPFSDLAVARAALRSRATAPDGAKEGGA